MCFAPWIYDYLGIETNPEACEMPLDVQALFSNLLSFMISLYNCDGILLICKTDPLEI